MSVTVVGYMEPLRGHIDEKNVNLKATYSLSGQVILTKNSLFTLFRTFLIGKNW